MHKRASVIIPTILIKSSNIGRRGFLKMLAGGGIGAATGAIPRKFVPPSINEITSKATKNILSADDIAANLKNRQLVRNNPANIEQFKKNPFGPTLRETEDLMGYNAMSPAGRKALADAEREHRIVGGGILGSTIGGWKAISKQTRRDVKDFFKDIYAGLKNPDKGFHWRDPNY